MKYTAEQSKTPEQRRYRVAVFVSDWNYEILNQYFLGLDRYVSEHPDFRVEIFDDFGIDGMSVSRNSAGRGGMEVFEIPDLNQYDGIIIQGEMGWPEIMQKQVIRYCMDRKMPVASLNYPLEHCTYVGTDNYAAVTEIMDHLAGVHHVKCAAFVNGPEKSGEAVIRRQAYEDACRRHGIATMDSRAYGGSWTEETGGQAAAEIMADSDSLPEAIVCANDWLAIGVIKRLQEAGYQVPRDVIVTGFDDIPDAKIQEPRLTTISRDYPNVARAACQYIVDIIDGKRKPTDREYSPSGLVNSESCGCSCGLPNYKKLVGKYRLLSENMRWLYNLQDTFLPAMQATGSLQKAMDFFEKEALDVLKCRWTCIVLNPDFVLHYSEDRVYSSYPDRMYLMAVAGEKPEDLRADPETHGYMMFNRSEVIPDVLKRENQMLIVYPLHDHRMNYGYLVIDGISPLSEYNTLEVVLMQLTQIIAFMRGNAYIHEINGELSELSYTDPLTGLYNRYGYRHLGRQYFAKKMAAGKDVYFYFMDIDDMKNINDQHGHDAGDMALRLTAKALQEQCSRRGGFAMRYGGDEFLYITDRGDDQVIGQINAAVAALIEQKNFSPKFTVSTGVYRTSENPGQEMTAYIAAADNRMYSVKKDKRIERRHRPYIYPQTDQPEGASDK